MLMPDLLPIRIANRDNLINNIKKVLKFSIIELETPLACFFAIVQDDRERRMIEIDACVDQRW
jgi:hypothetical protein